MLRILLLVLLIIVVNTKTNSQSDFRNGYYIDNNNDTIKGYIDFRGFIKNSVSCIFRKNLDDSSIIFKPFEIKAYRFNDHKYYVSKTFETKSGEKKLFLEFLISGQANIYYYRDLEGEHYLIDKPNGPLKEIPYYENEVVVNHVTRLNESKIHIGLLKAYLNDCPQLSKEIETLKKPNHDNMIALAKNYHQLVCNNNNCIIYEKPLPPLKVNIETVVGITKYHASNTFASEFGILFHIWIPRANEKFYFKTGYYHSNPVITQKKYTVHKFPVLFEYVMPAKFCQPIFTLGANIFNTNGEMFSTTTIGAGFIKKCYKKLYFSGDFNIESTPILGSVIFLNHDISWLSYSIHAGLYYRFN